MIRFVDFGNQISDDPDDKFFGFFDTTTDNFIWITGEQKWESEKDFIEIYKKTNYQTYPLQRFLSLIPFDSYYRTNESKNEMEGLPSKLYICRWSDKLSDCPPPEECSRNKKGYCEIDGYKCNCVCHEPQ